MNSKYPLELLLANLYANRLHRQNDLLVLARAKCLAKSANTRLNRLILTLGRIHQYVLPTEGEQSHTAIATENASSPEQSVVPFGNPHPAAPVEPKRCSSIVQTSTSASGCSAWTLAVCCANFFSTLPAPVNQLPHAVVADCVSDSATPLSTPTPLR